MKKRDFIFIVIVIAIAIIFGMISLNVSGDKGKVVFVSVNGDTYGEFSLYMEQKIDIHTENGYNTLTIADGYATVTASDCADHICEKTGRISEKGEIICCLPHKLIIEIK